MSIAPSGTFSVSDVVGNAATTAGGTDRSVTVDATAPTVTVNQAASQLDPTTSRTGLTYTVVFSEAVSGVTTSDFQVGGTATNFSVSSVTTVNSSTYTVVVAGAVNASNGSVTLSMAAGGATDAAGNGNRASTSTDNSITWDTVAPTVTLEQGSLQADPTSGSLIAFRITAPEDLSTGSVTSSDVTITNGTFSSIEVVNARWVRIWVTASAQGAVTIAPSAAFSVSDVAGNATSSTVAGSDRSVTYDTIAPTLTLAQAADQADPAKSAPVRFSLSSNEDLSTGTVGTAVTCTVTLDKPAGYGGVTVTPSVTGITGLSPFTIAQGNSSGTFAFTPPAKSTVPS